MKEIIFTLLILTMFLNSFSQSNNKIKFDSGYYVGSCYDNNIKAKYEKYLFLQFLSNNDDNMLAVLPYKMKKNNDINIYRNNYNNMKSMAIDYLLKLSDAINDIESHEVINKNWTIVGFDNLVYYEIYNDNLSFSLNIVDMKTDSIEIFYFDGFIKNNGEEIDAIIYSDKGTFKQGNILLRFIPNEKIYKN